MLGRIKLIHVRRERKRLRDRRRVSGEKREAREDKE